VALAIEEETPYDSDVYWEQERLRELEELQKENDK
jgi:hypothetical protein